MKSICILAVMALCFFSELQAQSLSVNTTGTVADNSSILDVSSTDKGMLIPRMSKAQRSAIAGPAVGLMVYQNAPDSTGFYFYDGGQWNWLAGNKTMDTVYWRAAGNAGTNINRHFIGTTDSMAISIKTYNSERVRITADGKIGIGTNNPFNKFTNTGTNIGGSDTIGVGNGSSTWVTNEIGYTQAIYNASPLIHANGLAVKIKGTTNKNTLFDLSTGSSQSAPGISVLTALGDGNIGIGTHSPKQKLDLMGKLAMNNNRVILRGATDTDNYIIYDSTVNGVIFNGQDGGLLSSTGSNALYWKSNGFIGVGITNPLTQFSNTELNIAGSDQTSVGNASITWATNEGGFTQALYNGSTENNADGLAVKIKGTTHENVLLDLSTGPVQEAAGVPVFTVLGTGNVGIGTSDPLQKLDLRGILAMNNYKILLRDAADSIDYIRYDSSIDGAKIKGNAGGVLSSNGDDAVYWKNNGHIGIGLPDPISMFANTNINIAAADAVGVGNGSVAWAMNEHSYVEALYNSASGNGANGLSVKIKGVADANTLLDLSTGATQDIAGSSVFTVLGSGKVGIGTNTPLTKLSNTTTNIIGSNGVGLGLGSLSWQINEDGFTQAMYNASVSGNAHGLSVKIAGTSGNNVLMDLSNGASSNSTGNPVFLVRGDGKTGVGTNAISERLTVNGAIKITDGGYTGLVNNASSPIPAGGAGTMVYSNGHFFGWNGSAWKQLDN